MKHVFTSFILSLTVVALLPASAFAHTVVPADNNFLPALTSSAWTKMGAASVATNGLTATIAETSTTTGSFYTDVSVKNTTKEYALLIAYTQAEDVRSGGDITGLPYIYGYFLDANGKVISYLQKANMRHSSTVDGAWDVSHGVFKIPSNAVTIRYFMKQASKKGTTKDGRDAIFAKPGVYLTERATGAASIIERYKSHLGNIWE